MMLLSFNVMPANWFWIVGGSATQVYSNASVLSAYQAAAVTGMDAVQNKILFNLNNRLRVLEGQPTLTAAQFIAAMASLV
jgi:hypothetical protein